MKKIIFIFQILLIYLLNTNISLADLKKKLINQLTATKTISFDFKQKIAEKEEIGFCSIKYPLLMKCDYQNKKEKSIIANGKSVAVIKKKYKKIYRYPIKSTPLFTILKKERIFNIIRNNQPSEIDSNKIEFNFVGAKSNNIKIYFDPNSLQLKGWETTDAYSNNVIFIMNNLKVNNVIEDSFFRIPKEDEL